MLEANQVGFLPTSERHKLYAVIVKELVKYVRVIVGRCGFARAKSMLSKSLICFLTSIYTAPPVNPPPPKR